MHGTPVKKRFSPSKVALLRVIFSMSAPHCLESRLPDLRRFSKSALILTKHWVFCENRRGKSLGPVKSGLLPYARLRHGRMVGDVALEQGNDLFRQWVR
jgi:hypothetical protein